MKRFLIMTVILTSVLMASCNVTRTITNESQYYQRGDTSVDRLGVISGSSRGQYDKSNIFT